MTSKLGTFDSRRPPADVRRFVSEAVETHIRGVRARIGDPELAWLFENCYPNTLDTTVSFVDGVEPDTFVITGDIDAMWLRDSSAQVWPYLPLVGQDARLARMFEGVIRRQARCVLLDPYANAFNDRPTGSEWAGDLTAMRPELHERKWEIDSLCYVIRLSHGYWKQAGAAPCFDARWLAAMRTIVETFTVQQRKGGPGPYKFMRTTPIASDTAPLRGSGNPTKPVGIIHSLFRPSDDACIFPFLVPANLFAVTSLRQLAAMLRALGSEADLADRAECLADEVHAAVMSHGVVEHPDHGRILAYEVDGFGGRVLMDDANVPSLLSMPYLGCLDREDPLYQSTRRFVWSTSNPYFVRGEQFEGVGGPHIGRSNVWPMSIVIHALTSNSDDEIGACVKMLKRCHAGTGFMHESFRFDDPSDFTRAWFAWANTLFGELIGKVARDRPHLLAST